MIYETEPKVCMKCRRFGHDEENCKGNKPNARAGSKSKQRWQVKQQQQPKGRSKSRPRIEVQDNDYGQKMGHATVKSTYVAVIQDDHPAPSQKISDTTAKFKDVSVEAEHVTVKSKDAATEVEHTSVVLICSQQLFLLMKEGAKENRMEEYVNTHPPDPKAKGKEIVEERSDKDKEIEEDTQNFASFCEGMTSEDERETIATLSKKLAKGNNKNKGKREKKGFLQGQHFL